MLLEGVVKVCGSSQTVGQQVATVRRQHGLQSETVCPAHFRCAYGGRCTIKSNEKRSNQKAGHWPASGEERLYTNHPSELRDFMDVDWLPDG